MILKMLKCILITQVILIELIWAQAVAPNNGLAKTPPMGWNSWNIFHENINENQIKGIADVMVSSGMRDAGYIYLNLDDNWMATSRDAQGNLRADPVRFPSGMKALGDYIHSKGLKFGIYGDRGLRTCHHFNAGPVGTQSGSYGNEVRDAATFASWGVDYLKYDNCEPAPGSNAQVDYQRMRDALAQSGRDIVYSICAWGFQSWMPNTGNLWRTTGDISDAWYKEPGFFRGIINIIDENANLAQHAKPGAWNDPDMLQIGNGGSTAEEYRTQMSLWSIMAAPLLAGNDIRVMTQETKDILLNTEVIAINQDPAGIQGQRISSSNGLEVWVKPLGSSDGPEKAVALLNRNGSAANITFNFADVGYDAEDNLSIRDLWAHEDRGVFQGSYTMNVPSHGTGVLKLRRSLTTIPGRVEAEHYSAMNGIQVEVEEPGQSNIGYIQNGDWVKYLINVSEPGEFIFRLSAGSASEENSSILIKDSDGNLLNTLAIDVSQTDGWKDWHVYSTTLNLPTGTQEITLEFSGGADYLFNIDWFDILLPPSPVPGKIEAEDYLNMSGLQTEPDADDNINIGFINPGDWSQYFINVSQTGTYNMKINVATAATTEGSITVKNEQGVTLGTLIVDPDQTDDWHDWYVDSIAIDLNAGDQELLLEYSGEAEYLFNIDWIEFAYESEEPTPLQRSRDQRYTMWGNLDASGRLYLSGPIGEHIRIEIFTLKGVKVSDQSLQIQNLDPISIDASNMQNLSAGLYYATINRESSNSEVKYLMKN
jgi:alpha-galactosidase